MSAASPEPDAYVVEHIRDALAGDPDIGVLDVEVRITGHKIFLNGDAGTPDRRAAVTAAVAALCPEHDVHNEMTVATMAADSGEPEQLT
jgi:osmotically-inducible protein OsmY